MGMHKSGSFAISGLVHIGSRVNYIRSLMYTYNCIPTLIVHGYQSETLGQGGAEKDFGNRNCKFHSISTKVANWWLVSFSALQLIHLLLDMHELSQRYWGKCERAPHLWVLRWWNFSDICLYVSYIQCTRTRAVCRQSMRDLKTRLDLDTFIVQFIHNSLV